MEKKQQQQQAAGCIFRKGFATIKPKKYDKSTDLKHLDIYF